MKFCNLCTGPHVTCKQESGWKVTQSSFVENPSTRLYYIRSLIVSSRVQSQCQSLLAGALNFISSLTQTKNNKVNIIVSGAMYFHLPGATVLWLTLNNNNNV